MLLLLTRVPSLWPLQGTGPLPAARAFSCCQSPFCPPTSQTRLFWSCHHPGSGPWCLTGGGTVSTPVPSPESGTLRCVLHWLAEVSCGCSSLSLSDSSLDNSLWLAAIPLPSHFSTCYPSCHWCFLGSPLTFATTLSQLLGVSTLRQDLYIASSQELVALVSH